MLRAHVLPDRCVASGSCQFMEPEHFEFTDEGVTRWRDGESELSEERLLHIARSCPVNAIEVLDTDGERLDAGLGSRTD